MSSGYIKTLFDVLDGKVTFNNVDKKKRGRKSGYSHSRETKAKIADKMKDKIKTEEVKQKISNSLQGVPKPEQVKRKISMAKRKPDKNSIAVDLLQSYSGSSRERDIPTSTVEWLDKCGHNKYELCDWIKNHYEEFNEFELDDYVDIESKDICSETRLKEDYYKATLFDHYGEPIYDEAIS